MWVGVADLINRFRQQTLGLRPTELGDGAATLLSETKCVHVPVSGERHSEAGGLGAAH